MQQLIRNLKTTDKLRPPAPIEMLLVHKTDLEAKCRIQEKKINENFDIIRANTSGILISGLTSLLFSSGRGRTKNKPAEQAIVPVDKNGQSQNNALFTVDNIFSVAKNLAPVVWSIMQPILIRWGINKVKSILFGSFSKKNRASAAK